MFVFCDWLISLTSFPGVVKNPPANAGDARFNLSVGKTSWSTKWQPTPVFLHGKFHRHGKFHGHGEELVGYSPWGPKESDMTE